MQEQSERVDIYGQHIGALLQVCLVSIAYVVLTNPAQKDRAYRCFCNKERLEAVKSVQRKIGNRRTYDGRCSKLSQSEVEARLQRNEDHVIRFRVSIFVSLL